MFMSAIAIGEVFGRLTVVAIAPSATKWHRRFLCRCSCGRTKTVFGTNLVRGRTQSCGCLQKERTRDAQTEHGHTADDSKTPEYAAWSNIIQRCTNKARKDYARYGGRGIRVCKRWVNSFEHFLADVGRRPSDKHSIDRIENDGHYEPGNVRWVIEATQQRNKRSSRFLEYKGERVNLGVLAARHGMGANILWSRLREGWALERALKTPVAHRR
jgi:hypothetical protein